MSSVENRFRQSLKAGIQKGGSGFIWMLKILVPISLLTALLEWFGVVYKLDFILDPLMGLLHLPSMAAIPLLAGILTGIYGAIAALAQLPMTVGQMTLVAVFLLISHNLIQESLIQSQSGLAFIKATIFRLTASVLTVLVVSWFLDSDAAGQAAGRLSLHSRPAFLVMLKIWAVATAYLSLKILAIIMTIMILMELMKAFHLADRIGQGLYPILRLLGLGRHSGFLWITAAIFGLTYGAAVIVEESRDGRLTKSELETLQLSIGINHAMIEDPALFLSLGLSPLWLWGPRLVTAILSVQLFLLYRRLAANRKQAEKEQ